MKTPWFWLAVNSALLVFMFAGLRILDTGPTPPSTDFDVARAFSTLQELIPDNTPHPTGSEENLRVRKRIEQSLESYGFELSSQKADFCTSMHAGCTAIDNLIAIKRGTSPNADAILITAHYDSAPAAPGAGDDLAGVAAMLEVAHLTAQENFKNDVIFLFADGEETGLRGAMAFAEQHPDMARVKLAINFEGRGVAGPSAMFETSDNNARLIEVYAKSAHRPVANSLMFEVYRKMPNNTDMTIYKMAGAKGFNFAFSRGVALYHSSRDSTDNLSQNSLAHHGDNLLTILRQTGSLDLSSLEAQGDSTYIDLFGYKLLHWPASLNLPAAIGVIFMLVFVGVKTNAFRLSSLALGVAGAFTVIAGLVLVGWALSFPLGIWPGIHPLDHPELLPARIALASASLLVSFLFGNLLCTRAGAAASLFVNWMIMALLALALAIALPGGSYLALAPSLVFVVVALLETFIMKNRPPVLAAVLGLCVAAYMSIYHFLFFDVVLNFQLSYLKTPILALMALASAPLVAIWRTSKPKAFSLPAAVITLVMVVSTGIAYITEPYTHDRPRSVNLAYMQVTDTDGATTGRWRLFTYGPEDKAFTAAAAFPQTPDTFNRFGGRESKAYFQSAQDHDLATPNLNIVSDDLVDGNRVIKGELAAGRSGAFFGITFPAEANTKAFLVNGVLLLDEEKLTSGNVNHAFFNGFGARALPFELHTIHKAPVAVTLFEVSPLPDDAAAQTILQNRPDNAAPIQFGDHSEVQRNYEF